MDYLVHHAFLRSFRKFPDKAAVIDSKSSLTYSQLCDRAGYTAEILRDAGIKKGDRVAFFLDHDVEQVVALLAISACGGVFIPISWLLYPEQVVHILKDSGARFLLTTSSRKENITPMLGACPELENVFVVEELTGKKELERTCPVIDNDLAALLYTSGSTGRPKGVMLSHRNLLAGSDIISDYLSLTSDDRLLGVLQLSFDYGLNQLLTMLAAGGTYRFLQYNFPNDIVKVLSEENITGFAGIPTIWVSLVRSTLAQTQLPHLRYITNSGGAVPLKVLEFLKKAIPSTEIVLMYGLTEAFRSTYLPPSELENHPTSMGKAIPDTEILVVSESGELCGPGEVGELLHRGPTVSLGYWKRPEETAAVFRNYSFTRNSIEYSERVVYSGDLVKSDDDGFLYFVGRRDGMIKCSGVRISPFEIEDVIFKTGLVHEVAAIGVGNTAAGQVVKIFVVPKSEETSGLESGILDFCAEHLPRYMLPRYIEIIDAIPKTAHGKIDYTSLKKMQ